MAVTKSRRPKDLYEDWAGNLDTLWSIKTWQEVEQQKIENKQKKKSSEIDVSTISYNDNNISYNNKFTTLNNKFTTLENSVDITVNRITILENRVSAVEAELQHKPKKRKIKIKIRG